MKMFNHAAIDLEDKLLGQVSDRKERRGNKTPVSADRYHRAGAPNGQMFTISSAKTTGDRSPVTTPTDEILGTAVKFGK